MSRNAQIGFFQSLLNTESDVFLLDAYPNAKVAYSLRKLSSTYAGSCIRVRRSSDNVEQDIGFVSNELDTTSLLSFVGANNGYVTTWYNQKGTGDNVNSIIAATQPQIVDAGSLVTVGGKPAIFALATSLLNAGNTSTFKYLHDGTIKSSNVAVIKTSTNISPLRFFWLTGTSGATSVEASTYFYGAEIIQRTRNGTVFIRNDDTNSASKHQSIFQIYDVGNPTPSDKLITYINDGSAIATNTSAFTPNTGNSTYPLLLFNYPNYWSSYGLHGYCQELIFWDDDYSADKAAINSNINNYYSIY